MALKPTDADALRAVGRLEVVPVSRVRKAYEQVADQLRALIMSEELAPGQRLPNEASLALQFGVSRATIREALRVLATQSLIRTTKGTGGGSFVTVPSVDHISEFLTSNLSLLSRAQDVSLDEFLEAREFLEVPAARLAARRIDAEQLAALRATVPENPLDLTPEEQFVHNESFHSLIVFASGNTLLSIAAHPMFTVLETRLKRSALSKTFHRTINHDHHAILRALEAGDEEAAATEMLSHLQFLRPKYEKAWRGASSASDG